MAEIAIGIDLGTSNSCVAVSRGGKVEVLPNAYGEYTTASVVAFREDGSITVGNAAKANVIHEPKRTIHSSKRLIGRYFFSEEVKKAQAIYSYDIVEAENHSLRIQVGEERFSLPEVAAMILREMKSIAESRLGQPVDKAVVTVPAYFNDNQRQATRDAGRIAGLEVLRILNEPTAAAVAYGFGRGLNQRVAVWDLGGGTFDISVLEIGEDVFEVLATAGDTFLGGDDFDDRLIDLLADEFATKEGINLRNDPYALEKLKVAAEGAKKALSVDSEVEIRIPDVIVGPDGDPRSVERTLTAEEYGTMVADLVQRTFKVCDEALQQAGVIARDLEGVILVGGPTRLPIIRDAVCQYFQQDTKKDVDPDQVVAMGAAIHAASLISTDQDAYLLDVTPLSLRIGVIGGLADNVIERNTPVPIEQTRTFTTAKDNQESVEIRVYQGESQEAEQNELLGQFSFSDFQKGRRGEVEIDVTFEINTDGIVNVTARDRATGQQASTRITLSSGLSEGEMKDIIEESRTDRVETTGGEVLGSIPLQQVAAEAPDVVELDPSRDQDLEAPDGDETDLLEEDLFEEEEGLVPLDRSDEPAPAEAGDADAAVLEEVPAAEAAAAPEVVAAVAPEPVPEIETDVEPEVMAEIEPAVVSEPESASEIEAKGELEDESQVELEASTEVALEAGSEAPLEAAPAEAATDEMKVIPEEDLEGPDLLTDDVDLDLDAEDLTELVEDPEEESGESEEVVEIELIEEAPTTPPEEAVTQPGDLFEPAGTDLSELVAEEEYEG